MPEIRKDNLPVIRQHETRSSSGDAEAEPESPFAARSSTPPKELLDSRAPLQPELATEILIGAEAIREWLGLKNRRQVYYLASASRWIPIWRLSGKLCALKSDLRSWINAQVATGNPKGVPYSDDQTNGSEMGGK